MCNRAERGQTDKVLNLFGARRGARFNEGPMETHPAQPGTIVRLEDGERVLEQMTWGFPLAQKSKKTGKPLKPKPVNNAQFDKLGTYWRRWAINPATDACSRLRATQRRLANPAA
jgi:putative SOS response-associated peptidase YedK